MDAFLHCSECDSPILPGQPAGLCGACALKGLLNLENDNSSGSLQSDDEPEVGEQCGTLFGDFDLIEEIARGGMGVVYKAYQRSLDRIVAVKMMLFSSKAASHDFVERFRREGLAAAALQHPNIVTVHEAGLHGEEPYLVMEYVDGPNLAQLVQERPLAPRHAATYMKTIAEAIHYAHQQGILHRDLKPSNVLIGPDDQPRITDFGLAKQLCTESIASAPASRISKDGQIIGAPAYMPPEQASGKVDIANAASDVYSLGATLYHLLTGRAPFGSNLLTETLRQVQEVEPAAPRLLNAAVPRDLEIICLKCLQKDPSRRYATARELAAELGRYLRGEPIQARATGRLERAARWCRRNPRAAAAGVVLFSALGLSLYLVIVLFQAKYKQDVLLKELSIAGDEKRELLKRSMGMIEKNLQGIWANKDERMMLLTSEDVALLANIQADLSSKQQLVIRWTMGITVEESPTGRARQHAKLIQELETRISKELGNIVRIDLKLYKYHEDIMEDLRSGRTDIARLGALRFLRAKRMENRPVPLVVPLTGHKVGIFFARAENSIRSLSDLRGKSMAFGDTNATISYWAQIKMAQAGITSTNLASYDFLDSTLEFEEDVREYGLEQAVGRIGWLHSHAQVIEGVLSGQYDVGVANRRAFSAHAPRGLVAIEGTEFESSPTVLVVGSHFDTDHALVLRNSLTSLEGQWLEKLPEQSAGFRAVTSEDFSVEDEWFDRIIHLFPHKPAPPRIKNVTLKEQENQ